MDPLPSPMVSRPAPTTRTGPEGDIRCSIDTITQLTRVEFLRQTLSQSLPGVIVKDMISAHRSSTSRQYQSSWKKFQNFLTSSHIRQISDEIFLEFASFLFHKLKLAIPTILTHLAAIADPLKYAFNVSPSPRSLELLKASFFLQRPPKRKSNPSWSVKFNGKI